MARPLLRLVPWLLVGATAAIGVAALASAVTGAQRLHHAGFLTYPSGAVAPFARAAWGGPGAGLRPRDRVLLVDGEAVADGAALGARLARLGRGPARITLRRPDGGIYSVTLEVARLSPGDLAYTFALPFSIGLLYLLLGAVVYALKRDSATALTLALCLVAAAFYLTMFDTHTSYRFTRLWLAYPLLGPLSVHLFALFPERRPRWARLPVLAPLYLAGALVVAWRQLALTDGSSWDHAALAAALMLAAEFLIDLGLLYTAMRQGASPAVRNRAKTTFVGLALTITLVIVWQFVARFGLGVMTADRAMIASALFPLLIAYALLARNLFDVDAVIRASLVYALATALVIAVYFAAVALLGAGLQPLLGRVLPGLPRFVPVASTLVAAAAFHPLRLWVQGAAERLLLARRTPTGASLAEELAALATALPEGGDTTAVAEAAVRRLDRLAGARGAALLTVDEPGESLTVAATSGELPDGARGAHLPRSAPLLALLAAGDAVVAVGDLPPELPRPTALAALDADLLVPLRVRGRLLGLLVLAPPRLGGGRRVEIAALRRAASAVALALDHGRLAAERAARERLATLGQLAAVIIHEIKNPLGVIKVSTSSLRKRAGDEMAAELLRCVEDEVERMDTTCRRLLELARPPALRPAPCDLVALTVEVARRLESELAAGGVTLRRRLPDTPLVADVDAEALRSLIVNLVHNARTAVGPGGEVTVEVDGTAEAVTLAVADNGPGLDEASRRHLFRPFYTTRHGGTGLGLAIVQRIVEEHHGTIAVDSRPGEGARFVVTLPRPPVDR